jgi:hypothetical protein
MILIKRKLLYTALFLINIIILIYFLFITNQLNYWFIEDGKLIFRFIDDGKIVFREGYSINTLVYAPMFLNFIFLILLYLKKINKILKIIIISIYAIISLIYIYPCINFSNTKYKETNIEYFTD